MTSKQTRGNRVSLKDIVLITIVIVVFCVISWGEAHYTREATVIDVTDNIITVVDTHDLVWSFEGDDFYVNEKVMLTMHTNHTDYTHDDIVEDAQIINR